MDCDCLVVLAGSVPSADEQVSPYQKSTSLHSWLFGYEFPDSLMIIFRDEILLYCSSKKVGIIEQVNSPEFKVHGFTRSKDPEANKQKLEELVAEFKPKVKKYGVFPKESPAGKVAQDWSPFAATLQDFGMEAFDATAGIAGCLSVKDEQEQSFMKLASDCSESVMKDIFVNEMATAIDEERKISHEKLSDKLTNYLYDDKKRSKLKIPLKVQQDLLDWCYTPFVQSGGNYELKPSAVSDSNNLHGGVIVSSVGVRYRNYCSNLGRTFLIDPTTKIEENYQFLLDMREYALSELKPGLKAKDFYEKVVSFVQEKRPDLVSHMLKNVGFAMGIEFRESSFVLNTKNDRVIEDQSSFCLYLGLQNLENPDAKSKKAKNYALFLSDTVIVTQDGAEALTSKPGSVTDVSFYFKSDDTEMLDEENEETGKLAPVGKSAVLRSKLRSDVREDHASEEQRRRQHQHQLLLNRQQEGINRYAGESGEMAKEVQQIFKRYESYKKESLLPGETRNLRIMIDRRAESVLLPIMGMSVPFHLNSLKNVSKVEEGEYCYLRFNFNTPAQTVKKDEYLPYDDPNAHFIRSLSFRSMDITRYVELYKQISEMKREITKKEQERRQKADLVEQDNLIPLKRPVAVLPDVNIRPPLEGKKLPGDLVVHQNGLRYSSIRGDQSLDILFSNIKHVFFQPCDNELYVIIHFHLKNPIMIGKKKSSDVQFIRDASESSFDETGGRRRRQHFNDEDELMAEQEERRRRKKLNFEFNQFAKKLGDLDQLLEADIPIRELGFNGVPSRSNVFMQPTTECLVYLSDPPFMVLTLADIELAYLERVQFHLKNFDIVFIFRDLRRSPIHINSIPMKQLESVKEWLDSVDIPFLEGPLNLNWNAVMKSINEDPAGFYQDGGWITLAEGDEDEKDEEDEEDSASEFEMTSDAEEDEDDFSESEFDEEEEDEEEDEFDEDEEDESGEDWDELERKAKAEDMRKAKRTGDMDDDIKPKKKRR